MLEIYAIPVSLYCAKLRILLRHKGLEWREIPPPGGYGSEEYKSLVPAGNLPALRDRDLLLSDSEAIAEYLNERHAEPEMLPQTVAARAKARELGRFHDTRLEPALRALFRELPPATWNADSVAQGSRFVSDKLSALVQLLEDHSLKRDLWLCDCGFAITFEWAAAMEKVMCFDVTWPEKVVAYRAALKEHPAVNDELSDYLPKLNSYLDGAV